MLQCNLNTYMYLCLSNIKKKERENTGIRKNVLTYTLLYMIEQMNRGPLYKAIKVTFFQKLLLSLFSKSFEKWTGITFMMKNMPDHFSNNNCAGLI